MIYSVDPGAHCDALSRFVDTPQGWRLVDTTFVKTPQTRGPYTPKRLVIEVPQIYPGQSKGDPEDVLRVRERVGAWKLWAANSGVMVTEAHPKQWKSGVPKPIHNRRILEALTEAERVEFCRAVGRTLEDVYAYVDRACRVFATTGKVAKYSRRDHNLLDSIGLGLWGCGRIDNVGRKL